MLNREEPNVEGIGAACADGPPRTPNERRTPTMKSSKLVIALVAAFALNAGSNAVKAGPGCCGGPKDKKGVESSAPKCPVTGESIDFSIKTDTKDGPVYFCCEGCVGKYTAKPDKYAKKVAAQREAVAAMPKVQVICPVTGEPIDKKFSTRLDGKKIYFCCKRCVAKFDKKPKKYAAKLADSYTHQTKCPVMGGDINPTVFSTLPDGRNVYYCCPGCEKPFFADPAKYVANLAAQGMKIDPEKIKASQNSGKEGKAKKSPDSHDHDGRKH